MNTVSLNNPSQAQRLTFSVSLSKYNFLLELLRHFDFVNIEEAEQNDDSRDDIIANLQHAGRDLKLIKTGKLEGHPVEELLNKL
jgi:hypothetical protein